MSDYWGRAWASILAVFLATSADAADTFTRQGLTSGAQMSAEQCRQHGDTAVWVTVDGRGDCIRYFHAGLGASSDVVHVWFHGDRLRRIAPGYWKPRGYGGESAEQQQLEADAYYRGGRIPYIHFSRPGTYGSSGFHGDRRQERNVRLVLAAVATIKQRHRIERFAFSGQSGGGHLVGALLANRDDILCAVATSGVLAVAHRVWARGWRGDATGHETFYDPVDYVDRIPTSRQRRIFIIGDPDDSNVPFSSQMEYYRKVKKRGHAVELIRANGAGSENHSLAFEGFRAVEQCVRGVPTDAIRHSIQYRE